MTGASLPRKGANYKVLKVRYVIANSPAAKAGLRIGDIFTAIDGKTANEITTDLVYKMLRVEGRQHQLQVKRDGILLSIKLKTRRLL